MCRRLSHEILPHIGNLRTLSKAGHTRHGPSQNANFQDTKCNPDTPNVRNDKDTSKESNKKVKVVETQGVNKKEMGMFYLKNAESRATDIFP